MNNNNGRINYQIGLDNSQLRAGAAEARNIFKGIGNSTVSEGRRIDMAYRDLGNSMRTNIGGAIGNIKGAILDLGKSMLGLTALMQGGTFLKDIYSENKQFGKEMRIVSTISQEVADDMENYKNKVLQMCTQIAVAPTEAAQALYQISSAGHLGADGMKVLEVSAKSAVGGVTEIATAADAITTILNAYHLSADEAEVISDKLFTTVRLGKTTMGELGQSISAVAPTAATFGVSIDEVLAMIAELTKQGVPTATAIRQINMAILAVTQSLGDGAFKTRTLLEAFQEVEKKSQGSENALKKDMGNVNALRAVLAATGDNAKESAQMLKEMQNCAGAAESAFIKMNTSGSAEIERLRNNFILAFHEMGDSISGNLAGLSKWLNEAFESGNMQRCLTVLTYLIAAYGTYKAVLITVTAIQKALNSLTIVATYNQQQGMLAALVAQKNADVVASQAEMAADLKVAVAKGRITAKMAEEIMALRLEVAAKEEALAATAQEAIVTEAVAKKKAYAALQANIAAKEQFAIAQSQLAIAYASGSAAEVEAAKVAMAAAAKEVDTTATALNTAAKEANAAVTARKTAVEAADTFAVEAHAAATTKSNVASVLFTKTLGKLTTAIKSNPYVAAAITVIALGVAIHKLTKQTTDAERATKALNNIRQDAAKKTLDEKTKIELLVAAAKNENLSLKDRQIAISKLNSLIPDYNAQLDITTGKYIENKEALDAYIRSLAKKYELEGAKDKLIEIGKEIADLNVKKAQAQRELNAAQAAVNQTAQYNQPRTSSGANLPAITLGSIGQSGELAGRRYALEKIEEQIRQQEQLRTDLLGVYGVEMQKAEVHEPVEQRVPRGTNHTSGSNSSVDRTADQIAERKKQIAEYRDAIIRAARDAQFEIREAEIAAMSEGFDKEIATAQLEYDHLIAANADRQREMIEALADAKTLEWLNANPKATKEQELAYRSSLVDPYSLLDKGTAGIAMSNMANGNVDMLARPLVEAAKLVEQGWTEAGEGIATVFSSDYDITGADGKGHRVLVTPILPDGTVLSPEELDAYVGDILNGAEDILAADAKGIVIGLDLPEDAGEVLRQLQEIYYMGTHESPAGALTLQDLSNSEQNILSEYQRIADEGFRRANQKALEAMLSDILDYEQRRDKVEREYAERRKKLYEDGDERKGLREGVSEGNLSELNRQEEEALKAVDEEFAQRSETYQVWCNEIGNYSLKALQDVLDQAKAELAELEKDPNADQGALSIARAKVNTADKRLKEANAKQSVSPDKRSLKEWQDLYKTLQDCEKEFEAIGDAVGGTAGEIISTAGQIATASLSMINGIMTLANWAVTAAKMSAQGASEAIQTVEKASVILTVISAAMQIAMTIVNLFNSDKQKQKEIERLQEMIDKLQWEKDHAEIMRYTSLEDSLNLVVGKLNETRLQLYYNKAAAGDYYGAYSALCGSARTNTELLNKSAKALADTYANMKYTADKALGEDRYKEARSQLENLAKQQILLSEQIENEQDKKKSDNGAIEEYKQKIAELGQEALELINDLVEDIMGNSAVNMAKELGDAFIDAFQSGEDAAEKWGEKVNDIVGDILKRMLVQEFLEKPLGALFDKYREKWFPNGMFTSLEDVRNSMPNFAAELNGMLSIFEEEWATIPDEIKDLFATEAQRQGAQKGIAAASQDSIDELNARMTTVQGHTYSISENMKILTSTAGRILESVVNIDRNTDGLSDRVAAVETVVKDMRNTLNDISLKGIKIK